MLVFVPELVQQLPVAALPATLAIVYMGLFPAAIAYVTWAYTLAYLPASRASSFLNFSPILAIIIAWIWLREIPTPLAIWGGVLVVIGVLLVNKRNKSNKRNKQTQPLKEQEIDDPVEVA
jgi:drug/metabolite transporter (DMT)-like permease